MTLYALKQGTTGHELNRDWHRCISLYELIRPRYSVYSSWTDNTMFKTSSTMSSLNLKKTHVDWMSVCQAPFFACGIQNQHQTKKKKHFAFIYYIYIVALLKPKIYFIFCKCISTNYNNKLDIRYI